MTHSPREGHGLAGLPQGWDLSVSQLLNFSSMSEKHPQGTQNG